MIDQPRTHEPDHDSLELPGKYPAEILLPRPIADVEAFSFNISHFGRIAAAAGAYPTQGVDEFSKATPEEATQRIESLRKKLGIPDLYIILNKTSSRILFPKAYFKNFIEQLGQEGHNHTLAHETSYMLQNEACTFFENCQNFDLMRIEELMTLFWPDSEQDEDERNREKEVVGYFSTLTLGGFETRLNQTSILLQLLPEMVAALQRLQQQTGTKEEQQAQKDIAYNLETIIKQIPILLQTIYKEINGNTFTRRNLETGNMDPKTYAGVREYVQKFDPIAHPAQKGIVEKYKKLIILSDNLLALAEKSPYLDQEKLQQLYKS